MSWDDLIYILDFCFASDYKEITYIIDQSEIHSDLSTIIVYTAKRMFGVCIEIRRGLPEWHVKKLREEFDRFKVGDTVRFVFRINELLKGHAESQAVSLFETFSNKVTLEYLLDRNSFNLSSVLDLVAHYRLRQELKIHSAPESDVEMLDSHISLEELRASAIRLNEWIPQFIAAGVVPIFNRSLPVCSFTDELLGKCCKAKASFSWLEPPEIEIFPDLALHTRYRSIAGHNASLLQFNTTTDIEHHFSDLMSRKKISDSCEQCNFMARGLCGPAIYSQ